MNPMRLALSLLLASCAGAASADDWPSFRGEFGRGVADDQRLPESWASAEEGSSDADH